jgi:lambda family phage portal protein
MAQRQMLPVMQSSIDRFSRSAFRSADDERVRSGKFSGGDMSIDADLNQTLEESQLRCLELYKRNPIAHAAVESRVANEIGTGIRFQSRVSVNERFDIKQEDADAFNSAMDDVMRRWSVRVDVKGVNSLAACERIVDRTFANYGEAFVVLRNDPTKEPIPLVWDIIDPLRVRTPTKYLMDPMVRLGIRYDGFGRIVGYYIHRDLDNDLHVKAGEEFEYIPAVDKTGLVRVCHIFEQMFPQQTRGFPWLLAAAPAMQDLDDWREAEIISKQIQSCFSTFIRSPGTASPLQMAQGRAAKTQANGQRIEEIRPGMVHYLRDGEEVEFGNPTQGAAVLAPFVDHMLRTIAAASNQPYEVLSKNFTNVTFASGRLALLDGRMGYLERRQPICEKLLSPTYELAVFQTYTLTDELDGLVDQSLFATRRHIYMRHGLLAPGWQFINPKDEVEAHALGRDTKQETLAESLHERGIDFEEHMQIDLRERTAEIKQEIDLRKFQWDLEESAGLPHQEEVAPPKPAEKPKTVLT